jgi:uncharacterized protein (TIGR03067 family)
MSTNRTDQPNQINGIQPTANDPIAATLTLPSGATQPEAAPPPLDIPPELAAHPRYHVVELLGSGGMGAVYRAEHRLMQRTVALKIINPNLVASKSAVERFRREVQAAARLDHPNIVRAYDAEQAGNVHFLVMEYANGVDLQKEIDRRGPLPIREACDYARQAALGLQHAHENGMVHRDIKPHNLMVVSGKRVSGRVVSGESSDNTHHPPLTTHQIKILDFGLASLTGETDLAGGTTVSNAIGLTQAGAVMGTPDYMSPEQGRDARSADIRADIYSLGCTLYTLLTGQVPFPGGSALEKVAAQIDRTPRPIAELRKDIPLALASVLDRMMAKDPANRFQTPAEVATALTPFAQPAVATERPRRPLQRLRVAVPIAAAALILVFGVINVFAGKGRLKIESSVDDVQIVVTKDGQEIETIDLKTGSIVKPLPSGDYQIKLKGDRTDVTLDRTRLVIRRWNEEVVKVTAVPTVAESSRDLELLQGEWEPIVFELQGQRAQLELLKKQQFPVKFIFKGNQWGAISGDGSRTASTLKLYPDQQPKWIDVVESLFGGPGRVHGIYKFEGDTVTVCLGDLNQPRPTEFTTNGKPAQILIVAKRIPAKGSSVARKRPTPTDEIAPKHRAAINKGLAYLAKVQHADGYWEANAGSYPVAMTALAGMAMLMEGSTIHDGDYANTLRKAVDWLMTQAQPTGLLGDPKRKEEASRYMFGHGYSLMFLATVYGQEEPGELRDKLRQVINKAINFTESAKTRNGGWGYVTADAGGHFDECATTIPQLQSLRTARNAGLNVSRKTLDAEYLRKFTGPNGGVVYTVTDPRSESAALSAAALAGCEFDSGLASKWLAFCQKNIPVDGNRVAHNEFTHYYYAQALYVLGEKGYERLFPKSKPAEQLTWSKYRASVFDFLVASQSADGSWKGEIVGPVYSTACYLTVLQLDNAAVPIYQR